MRLLLVRFNLATMMSAVALVSLAFAALRDPSDLWASITFTAAIGSAVVGMIGAVARPGPGGRLWIGSALSTVSYLTLAFGPWFSSEVRPHLLTTAGLDWAYPRIHSVPMLTGLQRGYAMLWLHSGEGQQWVESPDHYFLERGSRLQMNFERIGHSLAAMVCGLAGAVLTGALSRHRSGLQLPDASGRASSDTTDL